MTKKREPPGSHRTAPVTSTGQRPGRSCQGHQPGHSLLQPGRCRDHQTSHDRHQPGHQQIRASRRYRVGGRRQKREARECRATGTEGAEPSQTRHRSLHAAAGPRLPPKPDDPQIAVSRRRLQPKTTTAASRRRSAVCGRRPPLPSSTCPPQHSTPEARSQPRKPPDPDGGCPDPWPSAAFTAGEASAASKAHWARTGAPVAKTTWRERMAAPSPS
jgi:hypothetical protein